MVTWRFVPRFGARILSLLSVISLLPQALLRRALLGATLVAWAVLLGLVLLPTGVLPTSIRRAGLVMAVGLTFAYHRVRTRPLTGTDFVEPLRHLLFGPGMLPLASLAMLGVAYLGLRHQPAVARHV